MLFLSPLTIKLYSPHWMPLDFPQPPNSIKQTRSLPCTTIPTTTTPINILSNPPEIMADLIHRRSSYFSGCMSPSCVPVHEEYSRIQTTAGDKCQRSRRLRKLIRKIVSESKSSIYGQAKPLTFQYDAVSYSQNFDDGCHRDDEFARCRYVSRF